MKFLFQFCKLRYEYLNIHILYQYFHPARTPPHHSDRGRIGDVANSKRPLLIIPKVQLRLHVTRRSATALARYPQKWAKIDDLHISHNALGMGANIRVFLIRNSSSHSLLDVNGLELPCLAATMCFTRLRNQW